jgi:hypothetical protein
MSRIVDRLRQQAGQHFVGRESELSLFREALASDRPPFAIFLVHGPGGVGKTALLEQMRAQAAEAGMDSLRLDARDLGGSMAGLLGGLARALGLPDEPPTTLLAVLTRWRERPRRLLVIDTFEHLVHMQAWLRDHLLAELPEETLVVLAGRNVPDRFWQTDPLWRSGTRVLGLRNLSPDETDRILHARGIDPALREGALRLTYGHPLTLTLVADIVRATGSVPDQLDTDVIRRLTDCFTDNVPSPLHQDALRLCAAARATTQDMLAKLIDEDQAPALFDWLASLSFVEAGPSGLFPHDLVRDAVVTEARWRIPDRWQTKGAELVDYYLQRLRSGPSLFQRRMVMDLVFLHRMNPVMQRFFDFAALGTVTFEPGTADAVDAAAALARKEIGPLSEAFVRRWHDHPASHFWVLRDQTRRVVGLGLCVDLAMLPDHEVAADPAFAMARRWLTHRQPLRPGDKALCARIMAVEGGMMTSMPYVNALQSCMSYLWLSLPQLAAFFSVTDGADHWKPIMGYIDFQLVDEPPFVLDGTPLSMFAHDWRARPLDQWLNLLSARSVDMASAVETPPAGAPATVVLSQPLFEQAVREALRHWHDATVLAGNPLLRSKVVQVARDGEEPLVGVLQRVIHSVLTPWRERPRDMKFLRALELTYIQPVGSQELAAERLGVPFGTYRYQLGGGIERLARALWQNEIAH